MAKIKAEPPKRRRRTMHLAKLLREARKTTGHRNGAEAARKAGITAQRLCNIEHGRDLPPAALVRRLAKATGANPEHAIIAWAMDARRLTIQRTEVMNSTAALAALAEWWPTATGAGFHALVEFLRSRA